MRFTLILYSVVKVCLLWRRFELTIARPKYGLFFNFPKYRINIKYKYNVCYTTVDGCFCYALISFVTTVTLFSCFFFLFLFLHKRKFLLRQFYAHNILSLYMTQPFTSFHCVTLLCLNYLFFLMYRTFSSVLRYLHLLL